MLGVFGMTAAGISLSACGVEGQGNEETSSGSFWDGKKSNGRLDFANWPLYMDPDKPELKKFTEETDIKVAYDEAVQDNPTFFGKIQPALAKAESIGYDIVVLTNGIELNKMIELNYLAPLDHAKLPNFDEHAGQIYKDNSYDAGNRYTIPYASGITGIAYNPEYVDREITSIADLWDSAFEGKVGMMSDPQELANFGLIYNGVNPADSEASDWVDAADALQEQRDKGMVRRYYSQDYIQPLSNGDIWMSMAWSGDIFQQNAEEGTNLEFVIPEEGATLWSDNLMIPFTAKNPVDALMLMDFLYDPEIAASLTEYINYITPVPGARDILRDKAADASGGAKETLERVAESPLVFPSDADYEKLHNYVPITSSNEEDFAPLFQAVAES